MDEIMKYRLFFGCMKTLSGATMTKLLTEFDNEKNIYNLTEKQIMNINMLTLNQKKEIILFKKKFDINKSFEKLNKMNMKFVTMNMEEYPKRLKNIVSKPYQLFFYGELPKDDTPSVAIIGARKCSIYGDNMARLYARELAKNGIQIVSGLADGIDGIAQSVTYDAGGMSYGILGSGADICYPKCNQNIYDSLKSKGGIISEFAPGTPPIASNFPLRNRIISGLSDAVLVIEAKEKSGTAITVNMALEQGKDVYAVPGRCNDPLSLGCNKMIAEGAGIAYSPQWFVENLMMFFTDACKKQNDDNYDDANYKDKNNNFHYDNSIWNLICKELKYKEMDADELYNIIESKINMEDIDIVSFKIELMKMELENIVVNKTGLYYLKAV